MRKREKKTKAPTKPLKHFPRYIETMVICKFNVNYESHTRGGCFCILFKKFLFLLYFALQYCIGFAIHWHEYILPTRRGLIMLSDLAPSFFFKIFFKFFYFILLYNTVLVLPYINMNPPRVYTCSLSWTPLLPPSPYHPSVSSQCTSPKHPVSCIEPGLVIHFLYDIIHVSMPLSPIIPPSPSLTESERLFYTSVSLLLSHIPSHIVTIFLN